MPCACTHILCWQAHDRVFVWDGSHADVNSVSSQGWPGTSDPPSWVLRFQARTTLCSLCCAGLDRGSVRCARQTLSQLCSVPAPSFVILQVWVQLCRLFSCPLDGLDILLTTSQCLRRFLPGLLSYSVGLCVYLFWLKLIYSKFSK